MRTTPIRRAGNRVVLFMGGDRELTMFLMLCCAALIFCAMNFVATIVGLGLWFGGVALLRWMAKTDPQMRGVYLRAIRYKKHYPARATHWAESYVVGKKE